MGIHYTYGAFKSAKKMEKQAKKEKKLAERRARKAAKEGSKKPNNETTMHDISKAITLDDLTRPDKK